MEQKKESGKDEKQEVNRYEQINRLLSLYDALNRGEGISKEKLEEEYGVGRKTFDRDRKFLQNYYARQNGEIEPEEVFRYDKPRKEYFLRDSGLFTEEEVLVICEILLESRAFCREEKEHILNRMLSLTSDMGRKHINRMIGHENLYYNPPQHGKVLLTPIKELSVYIREQKVIEIDYSRKDGVERTHRIKPVSIMFSEFYFYLLAYIADDTKSDPTVFRVDRIEHIRDTDEHFRMEEEKRFKSGEFRELVHYMYSGEKRHRVFRYYGDSIEAVQDRFPAAKVERLEDGGYLVRVETCGDGAEMWLRGQGEWVEMVSDRLE